MSKLTLKTAKILLKLESGEILPVSSAKSKLIDELVDENIILKSGKHKKTLKLISKEQLRVYLSNQLQINNLDEYILNLENTDTNRANFVKVATNSKISKQRVFKGFLVNSYSPINAILNNQMFEIHPIDGSFIFIYDFENLIINPYITIIGVENSENFRQIQKQKYLFNGIKPLFISRYPQNQNKDFIKWIKSIPNKYLHFGDFDFAGIGIYLNEYKKYLKERAEFFIPDNIEKDIVKYGNRERFDKQEINFDISDIKEKKLQNLIQIIEKEKKGLDQEFFIHKK
jgi:DNA-binding phage protein